MGFAATVIVFCIGFIVFQQIPLLVERLALLVGVDDVFPVVCISGFMAAIGAGAILQGLVRRHDTGIKRRKAALSGYLIIALILTVIPIWSTEVVAALLVFTHPVNFTNNLVRWFVCFISILPFGVLWSGMFFLAIPYSWAEKFKRDQTAISGRAWFAFGGAVGLYFHLFIPAIYPAIILRLGGGFLLLGGLIHLLSQLLDKRALEVAFVDRTAPSGIQLKGAIAVRIAVQIILLGLASGSLLVVWYTLSRYLVSGIAINFWHLILCVLLGLGLGLYVYVMWARRMRIPGGLALIWSLAVATSVQVSYFLFVDTTGVSISVDGVDHWYLLERINELVFLVSFLIGILWGMITQLIRNDDFGPPGQRDFLAWGSVLISISVGTLCGDLFVTVLGPEETCFLIALLWSISSLFGIPGRRWAEAPSLGLVALAFLGVIFVATSSYPFGVLRQQQTKIAGSVLRKGELSSDEAILPDLSERLPSTAVILKTSFLGQTLERHLSVDSHMVFSTGLIGQRDGRIPVLIPLALGVKPEKVLQIAPGVEMSTAMLASLPFVKSIQLVDPLLDKRSSTVRSFASIDLREDKKITVEDLNARIFLRNSVKTYDLVTVEPPSVLLGKGARYFSIDFFTRLSEKLTTNGVVSLKVPVGELNEYTFLKVISGFCDVFPNCSLWYINPRDWLLTGGYFEMAINERWLEQLWGIPVIEESGNLIGTEVPGLLFSNFIADSQQLKKLSEDVTAFRDELWSGDIRQFRKRVDPFFLEIASVESTEERFLNSKVMDSIVPSSLYSQILYFFQYRPLLESTLAARQSEPRPIFAFEPLSYLLTETDLMYFPLLLLHSSPAKQEIVFSKAGQGVYPGIVASFRGIQELVERNYVRAASLFTTAIAANDHLDFLYNYRIFSLCLASRNAEEDVIKRRKTALLVSLAIAQERLPHTAFNREFWRWSEQCAQN